MKKLIYVMTLGTILTTSCSQNNAPKAEYWGIDLTQSARIERDKQTKAALFTIETEDEWQLYAGTSVDAIDFAKPIAEGKGSHTCTPNVPNDVRSYFQLVTPKGKAILAERHLPMTGGFNFRDMGGYRTTDGRYVKWGKIIRSDELHTLTDADLNYLASLPLISVVDFRSEEEILAAPDLNAPSVKNNYQLCINPGNLMEIAKADIKNITASTVDGLMTDLNVLLASDSVCVNQYRTFFAKLQNSDQTPLLFHCTAGKDRTGMGAALIFFALGVDEDTIMEDYLLSNIYLAEKYGKYAEKYPALKSAFMVKPEFLKTGLDRIKADHGTIENYLTTVLNVDIEKMREMYLYDLSE